jgi:hypothetical protein
MDRLVKHRGPVPAELWGADPRRCRVARSVSALIKQTIAWTSDNFLPNDPVDILLWGGWYGIGEVESLISIEERYVVEIPQPMAEKIWKEGLTLGQLVDYVIESSPCLDGWSLSGDRSLEARSCPSRAAFYDLRKFVEGHCGAGGSRLRPSSDLRSILPRSDWHRFDRFVQARFGARGLIRRRFLGITRPMVVYLVLSAVAIAAMWVIFWGNSAGWLLSSIACLIVLGILVGRPSWLTWLPRSSTTRNVVHWILKQRSEKRPNPA